MAVVASNRGFVVFAEVAGRIVVVVARVVAVEAESAIGTCRSERAVMDRKVYGRRG